MAEKPQTDQENSLSQQFEDLKRMESELDHRMASEDASSRHFMSSPDISMFTTASPDMMNPASSPDVVQSASSGASVRSQPHDCELQREKRRLENEIYKEAVAINNILMQHLINRGIIPPPHP